MPETRSPAPLGRSGNRAPTVNNLDSDRTVSGSGIKRERPSTRVKAIRPSNKAGKVKAFVDVEIGPVLILGAKLVQQPGQRGWVAMPSQKLGDGKWTEVIRVTDKEAMEAITAAVLAAWERANGRAV
jgi:DNA-binding cell septation regulator SpoVG